MTNVASTLEPSTRLMWCGGLGCDKFEKREGLLAMLLEASKSRIRKVRNERYKP